MSMSSHVVGFRPLDEKWKQMKTIYDACVKAKVSIPEEVDDFFNGEPPDPRGVKVDLEEYPGTKAYHDDMKEGFEVDLTKLSKDLTIIRFYNSY